MKNGTSHNGLRGTIVVWVCKFARIRKLWKHLDLRFKQSFRTFRKLVIRWKITNTWLIFCNNFNDISYGNSSFIASAPGWTTRRLASTLRWTQAPTTSSTTWSRVTATTWTSRSKTSIVSRKMKSFKMTKHSALKRSMKK